MVTAFGGSCMGTMPKWLKTFTNSGWKGRNNPSRRWWRHTAIFLFGKVVNPTSVDGYSKPTSGFLPHTCCTSVSKVCGGRTLSSPRRAW
ncbi:hypothetical protein AXF42_Ash016255 [Apostasia shenzhenica]|uniref:Uncharacterized protein n=1 Tax=Apostasia shenzhenica TaxID=1088818 RepID=A0A2H9ZX86_9ASPA|nr:hypothetical protein AXF42_Ash016255 [Apostasia shenzhenica]